MLAPRSAFLRFSLSTALLALGCTRHPPSRQTAEPPSDSTAVTAPSAMRENRLAVPGGNIWFRVVGSGPGTPVILLHGGPGYSSFYMKALEAIGADRAVVRYDQLGGGKSDRISDTTMFNIPHFVAELDSLRSALGYDKVNLVGHSWGTILAVEYYRMHPEHVVSLTLESPALDIPAWERHARELVTTLPDSMQRAIRLAEASGKFDAPGYQAAINEFYGRYVWRHPVQADLDSTFATVNADIYGYMQGPSEFTITGTLKQYDAKAFLPSIKVPMLYTVGEFDEANPPTVRHFAALTPGAEVTVIPGAAHITMWDAPEENVRVVREFLRRVDGGGP
jgi:proline iminopeptidase